MVSLLPQPCIFSYRFKNVRCSITLLTKPAGETGFKRFPCAAPLRVDKTLTETGGGQHPCCHVGRDAVWEDGLQDVAGEGEGDDGQRGRVHDEHSAPQQQKPAGEQGNMS